MKYFSLFLGTFACIWIPNVLQLQVSYASPLAFHRKILSNNSSPGVQLHEQDPKHVVIDNGIVQITLSKPDGFVTGVQYNGIANVLERRDKENSRGYWDVVWSKPGGGDIYDKVPGTNYTVIMETEDQVELSFSTKWSNSEKNLVPLNVDKRYIVRRGSSGFYAYAIMERLKEWPEVNMDQIRMVFKPNYDKFNYMVISDDKQRIMPTLQDRAKSQPLAYPEAVLLTHPNDTKLTGEVDDKYQYAMELKDRRVHGWIASDPNVGFWMIRPSDEFCVGGPARQDLTSHAGPNLLSMFTSLHYAGKDVNTTYRNGEAWKKVFGPVFAYLNSLPTSGNASELWGDAKQQAAKEIQSWPYDFPQSEDLPRSNKRGIVEGQLTIENEGNSKLASSAYVGLAVPGNAGSWQYDVKGYQFWTQADSEGNFVIKNVRAGEYNLFAWVPGFIGDYKYHEHISIKPGSNVTLGVLKFQPPRNGSTLWEIGIPDRSAAEFFVPDPEPNLINKLYINDTKDEFRQYGLWERYTDLYPENDLVYNVATSNYSQDWFFAHVPRKTGNNVYKPTTWEINFELKEVSQSGDYTLQLSIASGTSASLQVRVNDPSNRPILTRAFGKDNAIARHGLHGLYWLFSANVPGDKLIEGKNSIYLTQSTKSAAFNGLMYDYIRLEGPKET